MKLFGHPWSINTRKVLMALAEKGVEAEFSLVMVPKGEHKAREHLRRHPFGKVPVMDDDGFSLYETSAINRHLERKFPSPALTPSAERDAAYHDQWINIADAYFAPHAQPLIVEQLFRRYLGGPQNAQAIEGGRAGMQLALDTADQWLASRRFFAGTAFSLADIHWMPYLEYLTRLGETHVLERRTHLHAWWERASSRSSWQRVARSGPQPDEPGMTAEVIERLYRRELIAS